MITVEKVKEDLKEEASQNNVKMAVVMPPVEKKTVWYKKPVVIFGGLALFGLGSYFLVKKFKGNGSENINIS